MIEVSLSKSVQKKLERQARENNRTLAAEVSRLIEANISPSPPIGEKRLEAHLESLEDALSSLPGTSVISKGTWPNGRWWIKLDINLEHDLAWRVVQELGFVLNYVSMSERLPTVFMPVSPPPYLNGGTEFLSWVIESTMDHVDPDVIRNYVVGRLPQPIDNPEAWNMDPDNVNEEDKSHA